MSSRALVERLQRQADANTLSRRGRQELAYQRRQQRSNDGYVHATPPAPGSYGSAGPPGPRIDPNSRVSMPSRRPYGEAPVCPAICRPPAHAQFAGLAGFTSMGAEPKGTPIKKQSTAQVRKIVKQLSSKQQLTQAQAKKLERAGTVLMNRAENARLTQVNLQKAKDAVALKKAADEKAAADRAKDLANLQQQAVQSTAVQTANNTLPTGTPVSTVPSGGGGGGGAVSDDYLFGSSDDFSGGATALAPAGSSSGAALPAAAVTDAATAATAETSGGMSKGLLIAGAVVVGLFLLSRKRGRR